MKISRNRYLGYLAMGLMAAIIATFFFRTDKKEVQDTTPRDYPEIEESGVIRSVTEYNSISFFVDGDTISGFHYEIMNQFAREKKLISEMKPEMSYDKRLRGLAEGLYDIIAYSIPVTSELKDSILLTKPILLSKQVLVQRKATDDRKGYISSQLDLAHQTLHVVKNSPFILRIKNLSNEIGDTIYINEIDQYGDEQLMALVAHGDIDYAVCDEKIALASISSFPQLDINTDISFTQFYAWAVSKQSPLLLDSLNSWLEVFIESKEYEKIRERYY